MEKESLAVRFRKGARQWGAVLPFLSVGLILFITFVLFPQIKNVYIALTDYSIMPGSENPFVGLDNFKRAFEGMFEPGTDANYFWIAFRNNLLAVLVTVPGQLVLGLLVGWFWWQQNGLSSETITVSSAPDGFDGYRIAVVSDLHAKEFGEGNRVLLDYVRDLEPDLVAVVGDILHEPDQMSMIPAVAKGLAAIAPTYYVTGNHEWAAGVVRELEPLLEQCGVTVLSNEYVMLERNGDRIALLGAEDSNGYADQKTVQELADQVRQEQGAVYEILLSHRNNHYEQYTQARVDLTMAGHAHGGLIRLPGTDGLVGPKRELFPQYTAGLYDLSYGQMVVSRGLGNQFPCFRLLNRPDVPLVVLG